MVDVPGWDNKRIEREGGSAYLEAQRKLREKREREAAQREEQADLERFTRKFVEMGGPRSQAKVEWQRYKSETAREAAQAADQEARTRHARSRMRSV